MTPVKKPRATRKPKVQAETPVVEAVVEVVEQTPVKKPRAPRAPRKPKATEEEKQVQEKKEEILTSIEKVISSIEKEKTKTESIFSKINPIFIEIVVGAIILATVYFAGAYINSPKIPDFNSELNSTELNATEPAK
jgi:hypothetical protein